MHSLRGVTAVAVIADRFIHGFAQAVDAADGAVVRNAEPRVERLVVARQVLLGRVEILRRDTHLGHGFIRRIALLPFDAGVFDRHEFLRVLPLDLQHETRRLAIGGQLLAQRATQEIRQVLVLFGQLIFRAALRVGCDAELGVGAAELVGRD